MMLGELITRLEAANPQQTVHHGFCNPHSYRGDYMDLAFEPATNTTVADMVAAARSALGTTYQGWKGGDFTMTEHSWCWLSQEGDASGDSIGTLLLDFMLAAPSSKPDTSRLEAAARRALDSLADFILDTSDPGVEALGAQYELRQALHLETPPIPTNRDWYLETQRRDGSWSRYSAVMDRSDLAERDYTETVASYGDKRSYRLVCATTTYAVTAEHAAELEA